MKILLLLAGAPEAESLEWGEDGLVPDFQLPVRRFLGDEDIEATLAAASYPLAKWRDVPLKQHSETGVTAALPPPREATGFASFHEDGDDEHLQFLEYSLAVLQNLDSSQIEPPDATVLEESTYVTMGSFGTLHSTESSLDMSSDSLISYLSGDHEQQVVKFSGQITDLQRIPNARHLKQIQPQTMTINVLASVISVQPTRTVQLRKRSGEMDIVELLLGDETKAGFTTTFWFIPAESQAVRPTSSNTRQNELREMLGNLRPGDILLLTHIALAEFNSNVFGQSLSRRSTRNNTTVTVLLDKVTGLSVPMLAKLKRVRGWAESFVGHGRKHAASPSREIGRDKKQRVGAVLPPDTQYE